MNMTMVPSKLDAMKEKLTGDIQQLRHQLAFARRTPEKMTAFYGFSFISTSRLADQSVEIVFAYEGAVLLHVLLHNKAVSFYKFGLEQYVLHQNETLQLFEHVQPSLEELSFYLS